MGRRLSRQQVPIRHQTCQCLDHPPPNLQNCKKYIRLFIIHRVTSLSVIVPKLTIRVFKIFKNTCLRAVLVSHENWGQCTEFLPTYSHYVVSVYLSFFSYYLKEIRLMPAKNHHLNGWQSLWTGILEGANDDIGKRWDKVVFGLNFSLTRECPNPDP